MASRSGPFGLRMSENAGNLTRNDPRSTARCADSSLGDNIGHAIVTSRSFLLSARISGRRNFECTCSGAKRATQSGPTASCAFVVGCHQRAEHHSANLGAHRPGQAIGGTFRHDPVHVSRQPRKVCAVLRGLARQDHGSRHPLFHLTGGRWSRAQTCGRDEPGHREARGDLVT